ncbi:TonB-dependent receptor [Soonwooa buanensis]|nr:TonB-dependent receptor [Soonwooa buanensis]
MKTIFKLMFLLLGTTLVMAQSTYKVEGVVKDFHDKSALRDATVVVGSLSTKTDAKGNFTLSNIKAGTYNIIVTHPKCDAYKSKLELNKNLHLEILLEHHTEEIATITIHAPHKSKGAIIIKTLDKDEINRNSTENLGNLLTKISGVGTLRTGNSIAKPIIHGMYGSRISIINNGVKLAEQEWGVEHAPNVDINNFEHIDVIKGASALKYGTDAVGGVVVLEPEIYKKKDSISGSANLSGMSNGRGLGVDLKVLKTWENGWAIKTNGSYKKLGDLSAPNYDLMNTGSEFSSFNFTVQKNEFKQGISFDYYVTNQNLGIFRGSHVGNDKDFYLAMTAPEPLYMRDFGYSIDNPRQEIEHHIAKVSGFKRFENLGKISATYSFQYNHRKEYDLRRGDLNSIPSLDLELITNQFNINDLLEREKWSLETGIDLMYQNNYSNPKTQARRLVPNYDKYSGGLYSIFKYKLLSNLNVEAGARYDATKYNVVKWYDYKDWTNNYAQDFSQFYVRTYQNRVLTNPILNFKNFSYNVGIDWKTNPNFGVKFNYAKVERTPNVAELFAEGLHHSAAIIEKGNMRLQNESGHQFNLLIDGKADVLKGFDFSINPYYFITNNFINQIPTGIQQATQVGPFPVWEYRQINAKMLGVDVDVNLHLTDNLTYRGRGAYLYGQDTTNDEPLILMMPTNFSNNLEYQRKDWKNFYVNLENRTVLKQDRFPIHNSEITFYENGIEVTKTVDFSTPPPAYSLWNIQAGFNLTKNLSAGVTVQNLFNKAYRDYLNRLRYFSDDMGRNIIINFRYNF